MSEFDRIGYAVVRTGGYSYSAFGEVLNSTPASAHREARQGGLGHAISVLQSMIAEIDEYWVNHDPRAQDGSAELPWPLVHSRVRDLARARFEAGHLADAVEAAFKEINTQVKQVVLARGDGEHDGANLMNKAFSPKNPVIVLADLQSESGRNIQQGYMQIFAGAMIGIRNPKAHANLQLDRIRCIHLIFLASLLMHKLDESS